MSTERAPVTNIVFGTMTLGYRGYGSRVHDTATAAAMLTICSDAGYHALDTAHDYGGGSGEQMLGDLGWHNNSPSPPDTPRKAPTTPKNGTSFKPPSG